MAARIRLQRKGRKSHPKYRVVVTDRGNGTDAGYIESLGIYLPIPDQETEVDLDEDRVLHWLETGARPSSTVKDIFRREGILEKLEERRATA